MMGCSYWCDFTPKPEPISQPNANLSRAACPPKGGRAPPAAPFAFFLRFPPAEFLFLAEKGLAGGSPTAKAVEAARL
jgi:hypothetical protein